MTKRNQWQCPTCGTKQDAPTRPPVGTRVSHHALGPGVITSYRQCDKGDCIVKFSKDTVEWVFALHQLTIKQ